MERLDRPPGPARHGASPVAITLAGLAALAAAMGIGRFAFTPLFPLMQQEAGLSIADGAWLASANYVGYLLGALAAMAGRVPVVRGVRSGLVVIGLATLGMGLEARLAGWLVLRWLAGVASAWVLVGVSAHCLGRLGGPHRPLLSGAVFAGVGIGIAVAGVLCVVLMRVEAAATSGWTALGVAALAVAAATWRVFDGRTAASAGGPAPAPAAAWPHGSLRLVLGYGAFGFGYIIPATFLPVQARDAIGNPAIFGWAWPTFGLAAAGSALAAGLMSRPGEARRLWVGAQLVMALGVALPAVWPGTLAVLLAGLLVGGTFMVVTLAGMQEAQRVAGPRPARLMSAMTAAFAAGQIAGPLSVRALAGPGEGFEPALLTAAGVLAAGACAMAPVRWPGLRAAQGRGATGP